MLAIQAEYWKTIECVSDTRKPSGAYNPVNCSWRNVLHQYLPKKKKKQESPKFSQISLAISPALKVSAVMATDETDSSGRPGFLLKCGDYFYSRSDSSGLGIHILSIARRSYLESFSCERKSCTFTEYWVTERNGKKSCARQFRKNGWRFQIIIGRAGQARES